MKILLLANSDWFLHRFCSELAATLRAAGCEVVLASPPGKFAERLRDAGFRWRPVRIVRRELDPWVELRTVAGLRTLLRAERPDLVHLFTLKAALYGTLAARLSAAPGRRPAIVNSITGLGYLWSSPDRKVRLLRWLAELAARRLLPSTRVIFLNRDDLEECSQRRWTAAQRSHLIPGSGVDTERFRPSPPSSSPPRPSPAGSPVAVPPAAVPVVAFVGRLLWSKGAGDFVAAACRLRQRGVDARFVLVGESDAGNPDTVSAGKIANWRRQGVVEVWGFQDDMADVYRRVSIVCLPTTYREGVPTVLLEAAACGKPVVATRMPGCREAVADGVTGLLVPPGDVAALSEALTELLADPSARRRMGEAGRRRARDRFDVRLVVAATLQVYRQAGIDIRHD